jgi:hypothetical protein
MRVTSEPGSRGSSTEAPPTPRPFIATPPGAPPPVSARLLGLLRTAARFIYNLLTDPFPR